MKKKQKNKLVFKSDSTKLSDEQIAKHRNFGKLMHEYQVATKPLYQTPLYKNKKVFLVVLLILLLLFLVIESIEKEEKDNKIPTAPNTEQLDTPPE